MESAGPGTPAQGVTASVIFTMLPAAERHFRLRRPQVLYIFLHFARKFANNPSKKHRCLPCARIFYFLSKMLTFAHVYLVNQKR